LHHQCPTKETGEGIMKKLCQIFFILLSHFCLDAVDIALTIDDYPMEDGLFFSAKHRTQAFIEALEKHCCKAAFFCIGNNCTGERGSDLLLQLDKSGQFLCNHSMTHGHLSSQSLDEFEKEIQQVHSILSPYKNMRTWYRYPFLDYGHRIPLGGSYDKAFRSLQILNNLGYSEGYVTINTFDWYINQKLSEAIKQGFSVNYKALKELYIEQLKSWCDYYINFYEKMFPEKITHTLLLHANDLNALFLYEIITMLKDSGWSIVSPEQAFSDVSWRSKFLKNPEIVIHKPLNLDCLEIDKVILEKKCFL
jgi:peptidoglycan/xylan/chitin deacetylase (PgdA/CDA1 family)